MSEVMELLSDQLSEEHVDHIARQLGTDPKQTQEAIAVALPTLISTLGRTAETEEGSQMVARQIQGIGGASLGELLGGKFNPNQSRDRDASELGDIFGQGVPSDRRSNPSPIDGSALSPNSIDDILTRTLGDKQGRVEKTISKSSGMDLRKIGPLLMFLLPVVLSAMKSRAASRTGTQGGSLQPGDLSDLLRKERQSIEKKQGGSLIGRMLDQDGDGDFDLSDILKLGMSFFFGRKR